MAEKENQEANSGQAPQRPPSPGTHLLAGLGAQQPGDGAEVVEVGPVEDAEERFLGPRPLDGLLWRLHREELRGGRAQLLLGGGLAAGVGLWRGRETLDRTLLCAAQGQGVIWGSALAGRSSASPGTRVGTVLGAKSSWLCRSQQSSEFAWHCHSFLREDNESLSSQGRA